MEWRVVSNEGNVYGEKNEIPSNTLAAFERLLGLCKDCPDPEVNFPVRMGWAGKLPVPPRRFLENITRHDGFTRAEMGENMVIEGMDGREPRVPTLPQVLELFNGRGVLHIEVQNGLGDPPGAYGGRATVKRVVALLDNFPKQRVCISSRNHRLLLLVPAHLPVGIVTDGMPSNLQSYAEPFTRGGCRPLKDVIFYPDFNTLTRDILAEAREAGIEVIAHNVPRLSFSFAHVHGVGVITDDTLEAWQFRNMSALVARGRMKYTAPAE